MRRTFRHAALATLAAALLLAVAAPASHAAANWTWASKGKVSGNIGSLDEVQCPTARLCVAGGGQAVWVTTTPTGRASTWRKANISQVGSLGRSYIFELSCPTATFCVAGDDQSNVMTTTNPAGGAAAWIPRRVPYTTYVGIRGMSCASPMLCAITDVNGYAMTSTNPVGGIYSTTQLSPELNAGLYDLSCAARFCASVQDDADLWTTADATGQPATWRKLRLGTATRSMHTVGCAAPSTCVAAGSGNRIRVSTNPTGPLSAWRSVSLPRSVTSIEHAYCRPALCMLTSGTDVWWSPTPAVATSWKKSTDRSRRVILSDVSCPTPRMCVLIDVGSNVWVGTR
jgi:hypothetical protein